MCMPLDVYDTFSLLELIKRINVTCVYVNYSQVLRVAIITVTFVNDTKSAELTRVCLPRFRKFGFPSYHCVR